MPRLISFHRTTEKFLAGAKTVTRRRGWTTLEAGTVLMAVDRLPRSGYDWERLGLIETTEVWTEPLGAVKEPGELTAEGFPEWEGDDLGIAEFVWRFLGAPEPYCLTDADVRQPVTRIAFRRLFCEDCRFPDRYPAMDFAAGRPVCTLHAARGCLNPQAREA